MPNIKVPERKDAPTQPFPDQSEETDRQRTPAQNDRMREKDATSQDEKTAAVDRVHGVAR